MPKKSKKQKSKAVPKLKGEPVFVYTSACHSARATKVPVMMPEGRRVGEFGSSPDPEGQPTGLGKFRCEQCGKPCKVTRTRNTPKKAEATQ